MGEGYGLVRLASPAIPIVWEPLKNPDVRRSGAIGNALIPT